jgi:hypothetical protein
MLSCRGEDRADSHGRKAGADSCDLTGSPVRATLTSSEAVAVRQEGQPAQ